MDGKLTLRPTINILHWQHLNNISGIGYFRLYAKCPGITFTQYLSISYVNTIVNCCNISYFL